MAIPNGHRPYGNTPADYIASVAIVGGVSVVVPPTSGATVTVYGSRTGGALTDIYDDSGTKLDGGVPVGPAGLLSRFWAPPGQVWVPVLGGGRAQLLPSDSGTAGGITSVASGDITDATTVGKNALTAPTQAAARDAIGAVSADTVAGKADAQAVGDALAAKANTSDVTTALGAKANDSAVVKLTGAQDVAGVKTFTSKPVVPDDTFSYAKIVGLAAALGLRRVIIRWNTATNSWPKRPSAVDVPQVTFSSTHATSVTPPADTDMAVGDTWEPHPDQSFA